MVQGAFVDKEKKPTLSGIRKALGKSGVEWTDLAAFVRENFTVREELKFYGKNFGWALRFRKAGKALVSLYPLRGGLKAQVVLNEAAVKRALKLPLGVRLHRQIRSAYPYPDGRWLFIDVRSKRDADRVKRLIFAKVNN